jgi:hypothetical protein
MLRISGLALFFHLFLRPTDHFGFGRKNKRRAEPEYPPHLHDSRHIQAFSHNPSIRRSDPIAINRHNRSSC